MLIDKKKWKAFIPQHIPNSIVSGVMSLLSVLFKTGKKQVAQNKLHNTKILVEKAASPETKGFFVPGAYIENQRHWDKIHFGNKYTMAYGGCEIFAVYNALLSLGKLMTGQELVELISLFERKGAVLAGKFGGAPKAAYRYFQKNGYEVCMITHRKEEAINALGEENDTVIVTAYNNGQDILGRIHTVNFSKDAQGHYFGHNCYKLQRTATGSTKFVSDGPHDTLWEAIHNMSGGKAVPLCVIGIRVDEEI